MIADFDFATVFRADFDAGKLYWRNPPKNHAEKIGREAGAINIGKGKNKSYWQVRAFGRTFKRSRVIFRMAHGRWPDPMVDHINGDSLDDRPVNLRECSPAQNAVNSRDKRRSTGLPRGVYRTAQGRFMARLTGKSLGTFDTPDAASAVYLRARKEAFRDFA
jgi:hypothetical protein